MRLSNLESVAFRDFSTTDQLNGLAHHLNELVVVLAHLSEQLDLVLGHKLEPVEIVAELVELTQRSVEGAFVVGQQRGGDAVKLGRGIVLELAVRGNFSLELYEILSASVSNAQRLQTDCAERDKQHCNGEKGDK